MQNSLAGFQALFLCRLYRTYVLLRTNPQIIYARECQKPIENSMPPEYTNAWSLPKMG